MEVKLVPKIVSVIILMSSLFPREVSLDPEVPLELTTISGLPISVSVNQSAAPSGGVGKPSKNSLHSNQPNSTVFSSFFPGSGTEDGPGQGLVVTTSLGQVRGRIFRIAKTGGLVGGFLGLPYAQPPIHHLRFRPPMEIRSWGKNEDDILNGTDFGPICFQPAEQKIWDVVMTKSRGAMIKKRKLEAYPMSEDCLTINLYVPLNGNGTIFPAELPVLFFIHGGSYYMNGGRLYPGQILASTQNLIVVTFNYRLGPLGFLSTGDQAAAGNYGMLDQVLALNWVHKHIHTFGGDSSRITLVGNSAGAASVMFHMFSDLSKGKFVGVTIQSGCSGAPWAVQPSPRKHAEALAVKLGCPLLPTTDLVDCIRNFSPQLIMKHAKLEDGLSLAFATVIDGKYGGKFLMDHPETLIRSKQFHPVPVLTGFTRDEVTIWFTKFGPSTKTKDLRSFVQVDVVSLLENLPTVTQANVAAMIHSVTVQYLYRAGIAENDTMGKTNAVSDFISDVGLKAPCIKEMNLLSKYNSEPIYLYEFVYFSVDDYKMGRQEWIGAYHESELQFIFGEPYLNYSNHLRAYDDKKISDMMMKVWANFIKHGTPTPHGKAERSGGLKFPWTNYSEEHQDFAVIGLKPHMKKYFLTDRMLFWNFFFPIFRDFPFQYEPKLRCEDWEALKSSWIVWLLVSLVLSLTFALVVTFLWTLRSRICRSNRAHHRPAILTNSNNSTAPHAT